MTNSAAKLAPVISIIDGKPVTNSLDVASHFNKRHERVLNAIRNLDCSPEFNEHNFVCVDYLDSKGETRPMFRITRDGFVFLCMGFTGKEAAKWKEAYIALFNKMESALSNSEAPNLKTKKALPNGLTLEQCDSVKALVKARVEACPKDKQAKAAITCWSALKSKFGCTYKEILPANFSEALSLVARLPLEGEYLPQGEQQVAAAELPPIDVKSLMLGDLNELLHSLSTELKTALDQKAIIMAMEAHDLCREHLVRGIARYCENRAGINQTGAIELIERSTLGHALAHTFYARLKSIENASRAAMVLAAEYHAEIQSAMTKH